MAHSPSATEDRIENTPANKGKAAGGASLDGDGVVACTPHDAEGAQVPDKSDAFASDAVIRIEGLRKSFGD